MSVRKYQLQRELVLGMSVKHKEHLHSFSLLQLAPLKRHAPPPPVSTNVGQCLIMLVLLTRSQQLMNTHS